MDSIKKYINRFFGHVEINGRYGMMGKEWSNLVEHAKESPFDAVGKSFLFGYAKGYRAAMAEVKKMRREENKTIKKIVELLSDADEEQTKDVYLFARYYLS